MDDQNNNQAPIVTVPLPPTVTLPNIGQILQPIANTFLDINSNMSDSAAAQNPQGNVNPTGATQMSQITNTPPGNFLIAPPALAFAVSDAVDDIKGFSQIAKSHTQGTILLIFMFFLFMLILRV